MLLEGAHFGISSRLISIRSERDKNKWPGGANNCDRPAEKINEYNTACVLDADINQAAKLA